MTEDKGHVLPKGIEKTLEVYAGLLDDFRQGRLRYGGGAAPSPGAGGPDARDLTDMLRYRSAAHKKILLLLSHRQGWLTRQDIADALGESLDNLRHVLTDMADEEAQLLQSGRNGYRLNPACPLSPAAVLASMSDACRKTLPPALAEIAAGLPNGVPA